MPNAACTVRDGAGSAQVTPPYATITPAATATIALADVTGVSTWAISCVYADETTTPATITASLTINSVAKTATFTAPTAGRAMIFQSVVNGGVDANGTTQADYTKTFKVCTLTGGYAVGAANETTEHHATYGSAGLVNAVIRNLGTIAAGSIAIKAPVKCATTANISLTGEQTLDAVLTSASRVLVKDQTAGAENGIYVSAAGAWTRATDFDSSADAEPMCQVAVSEGTANGNKIFALTTNGPITLGTTALVFATSGSAPTGSAGGSLGSTYPNPTVVRVDGASGDLPIGATTTTWDSGGAAAYRTISGQAVVQTTNATVTSLLEYALGDNRISDFAGTIVAFRPSSTDVFRQTCQATYVRNAAGAPAIQDSNTYSDKKPSASTCVAIVDLSSNTLRVRVTGIAAQTWNWYLDYSIMERT